MHTKEEDAATKRPPRKPVSAPLGAKWFSDLNLAARYGCHWMTPWRWSEQGSFPQPYKLGPNMTRWSAAEIEAHDRSVIDGGAK